MQEITVIGPGRMGGALALACSAAGDVVKLIVYHSRRPSAAILKALPPDTQFVRIDKLEKLTSGVVLITVPDDSIVAVANTLADRTAPICTVFHTSGSMSSKALAALKARGCAIGSIHPLASISAPSSGPERFRGAYFCVEGDTKAVRLGRSLVRSIGGRPFAIDADKKALYHAAAVTAAGHVTALFDVAASLMTRAGLDRKQALAVMRPLLEGATANLQKQDPIDALTGPFARADIATFERQLKALNASATKSELQIYLDLAARSLDLVEIHAKNRSAIAKMRELISLAKQDIEC
ncbi:MAG TPA: DUF2520 domain-containing protein [Pyrinomonadaceae bacterium]